MFMKQHKAFVLLMIGILLAAISFLWNPFGLSIQGNITLAIAFLMISWWVLEALPMPAVALVPLVLYPLFGISSFEETARSYANPAIFLFMGGFLIGLAIEKWNLHKRIALLIVSKTGSSGNRIILGFILATGFLSMWLSNTATAMMMLPIALSVVAVMKAHPHPVARDASHADRRGQVGLARTRPTNEHRVVCRLGKRQVGQPHDQGSVYLGGLEVETRQVPVGGESRCTHLVAHRAHGTVGPLGLQQVLDQPP